MTTFRGKDTESERVQVACMADDGWTMTMLLNRFALLHRRLCGVPNRHPKSHRWTSTSTWRLVSTIFSISSGRSQLIHSYPVDSRLHHPTSNHSYLHIHRYQSRCLPMVRSVLGAPSSMHLPFVSAIRDLTLFLHFA